MEKLYKLQEVAEVLGVTRRTLYTWIKDGKLETVKVGREHRVPEEALKRITSGGIQ